MTKVFLSYCSLDRDRVAALEAALSDHGLEVWWDKQLTGGDFWKPEIAKRLGEADAIVVLWTPNSVDRDYVKAEAVMALGYDCMLSVRYSRDVQPPDPFGKVHAEYLGDWNEAEKRAPEIGKLVAKIKDKKVARDRQKRAEALPEFERIRKKTGPVAALFGSALPGGLAVSRFLIGVVLTWLGAWLLLLLVDQGNPDVNNEAAFLAMVGVAVARALDQFLIASRRETSIRFFDRFFSQLFVVCLLTATIFFAFLSIWRSMHGDDNDLGKVAAYTIEATFGLLMGVCLVRLGLFLSRSLANRL